MNEEFEQARGELRRADHLMYVSLKYTRTVDVIKSLIDRLINTYNNLILSLLKHKKIRDPPRIPRLRVELIRDHFGDDDEILSHMMLYLLLRDISKAPFSRRLEFRRHVTMTANLDDKEVEVTIDICEDYFKKVREFISYVHTILNNTNNTES